MKILECSSVGDKRFSAFFARVKIDGVLDSIENHYQKAKILPSGRLPKDWRDGKGSKYIGFHIRGMNLDRKYLPMFYDYMWYKYLKLNPSYVEFLKGFDGYSDKFSKRNITSQDKSIAKIITNGFDYMEEYTKPLMCILRNATRSTLVVNRKCEDYDIYIGRGSKWGNPFHMKNEKHRDIVIDKYKTYIMNSPHLLADIDELRGMRLGCYCAPKRCHGEILIDIIRNKDSLVFRG